MILKEGEKEAMSEWRFGICFQLGFEADDATVLAERQDIDLHTIIDLVQIKGCPPQQAIRILL